MTFSIFAMQFVSGLTRGMILFLIASGLTLIFGVARVLNLAHAAFYMLGAFFGYALWSELAPALGFWGSAMVSAIAMGLLGLVIERGLMRRLYVRGWPEQIMASFALIYLIADLVRVIWGGQYYSVALPKPFAGSAPMIGAPIPSYYVFLIIFGFAIAGALWWLIYKTHLGTIIRASTSSREMVSALGIPIPLLFAGIFALGIFLAGLSGTISSPVGSIALGMDMEVLIECFVVVVIGGLGSLPGALLGAFIVGQVYSFGVLVLPQYSIVFIFIVMCIVLIIRPQGIFGIPGEEVVE